MRRILIVISFGSLIILQSSTTFAQSAADAWCDNSYKVGCVLATIEREPGQYEPVHYNGEDFTKSCCGTDDYGNLLWQCVELVKRYYRNKGYKNWNADAFELEYKKPDDLNFYPNGGPLRPKQGDVLIFSQAEGWELGHAALVKQVTPNVIFFVQQNKGKVGEDSLEINGTTIKTGKDYPPVRGWLQPSWYDVPVTIGGGPFGVPIPMNIWVVSDTKFILTLDKTKEVLASNTDNPGEPTLFKTVKKIAGEQRATLRYYGFGGSFAELSFNVWPWNPPRPTHNYTAVVDLDGVFAAGGTATPTTVASGGPSITPPPQVSSLYAKPSSPSNGSSFPYGTSITLSFAGNGDEYYVEDWGAAQGNSGWRKEPHGLGVATKGTHYWHVKTRKGGQESPWSETWSFTITDQGSSLYAQPVSPPNGSSFPYGTEITLQFTGNGDEYYIEDWGAAQGNSGWRTQPHGLGATPKGVHYWHVKTRKSGQEGGWSETWTFTITDPGAPTPIPTGIPSVAKSGYCTNSTVAVNTRARWNTTGIVVNAGDNVLINASGTAYNQYWDTATGKVSQYGTSFPMNPDVGQLSAKIGESGAYFFVGSSSSFIAQQSGTLYLGAQPGSDDAGILDNEGSWNATVQACGGLTVTPSITPRGSGPSPTPTTNVTAPGTIAAPMNLTVFSATGRNISLGWSPSSDAPANIDGYYVYFSDGRYIGGVDRNATTYTVQNQDCNTYSFYVKAYRQSKLSAQSNIVSATLPCPTPVLTSTRTSTPASVSTSTRTFTPFPTVTRSPTAPTKPSKPLLVSPPNGSSWSSTTFLTVTWTGDGDEYYAYQSQAAKGIEATSGWTRDSFWRIGPQTDGTFIWKVKSRRNGIESDWSDTWTFTIYP